MNDFLLFFKIGWGHLLNEGAADHILYLLALISCYSMQQLKRVLLLITAFTVGHTITLALSVFSHISFPDHWVEFFIAVTLLFTSIFNIFQTQLPRKANWFQLNYMVALCFGLIHGMGFAGTIKFLLAEDQSVGWPLLSFNVGLEVAQILLVLIFLITFWLLSLIPKINLKHSRLLISVGCGLTALLLCVERWPL